MEIVRAHQKEPHTPSPTAAVYEYSTADADLSGATAEIKGRYPEQGFVMNTKIKELAFVMSGAGALLSPQSETPLAAGDLVLIDKGEAFAWAGDMTLFIATAPRFDSAQYLAVPAGS